MVRLMVDQQECDSLSQIRTTQRDNLKQRLSIKIDENSKLSKKLNFSTVLNRVGIPGAVLVGILVGMTLK